MGRILLYLVALLCLSAQALAQSEHRRGVISGRATDAFGCPIYDGLLKLRPAPAVWDTHILQAVRSDRDGNFEFDPAPVGSYSVQYHLDTPTGGAASGSKEIALSTAGSSIDIQLRPPSSLDIVDLDVLVTDTKDTPIAGARVTFHRLVGNEPSLCASGMADTGQDGHGRIAAVSPGRYRISAEAEGFATNTAEVRHGWSSKYTQVRLFTPAEAEKFSKPTRILICCGLAPPKDAAGLVAGIDAILVGRVSHAVLDPDYSGGPEYPSVRTRLEVQPLDVIKGHQMMGKTRSIVVLHFAGEIEIAGTIVLGCQRESLTPGGVYLLFLNWDDYSQSFVPAFGNALQAELSTGLVKPVGPSNEIAAFLSARRNTSVATLIRELRSATQQ